jgi:hypothetical protein
MVHASTCRSARGRSVLAGLVFATWLEMMPGASPSAAQEDWSLILAAIGADDTAAAHAGRLMEAVRAELETHAVVPVRDVAQDLRVEMPAMAVFQRAVNLQAGGAAVIEVHVPGGGSSGYAHLWVSSTRSLYQERVEYLPDLTADVTGTAQGFAATIIRTVSRGAFHLVEFHVFTWPRAASVVVGDGAPVVTDGPGREPGEGYAVWRGVRPAGTTEIRFARPGYQDRVVRYELPTGNLEPARLLLEVTLTAMDP